MVCMIADYKKTNIDMHNEYIISGTSDHEKAVCALAGMLERQGFSVSCITVCPDAKNFEDLRRIADEGIRQENGFRSYIFDVASAYGT